MEIEDIVMKLIGPIEPIGESNFDKKVFKNIEEICDLTSNLIRRIYDVKGYSDRYEYSMKKAGREAELFFLDMKELFE